MLQILNKYEQDNYQITEYTKDGTTVSHTVKMPIQTEPMEPVEPQPSIEEQILVETQYQTVLLEMNSMF